MRELGSLTLIKTLEDYKLYSEARFYLFLIYTHLNQIFKWVYFMKFLILAAGLFSINAFSAEADNFTAYKLEINDQTEILNNLINTKISAAVERANLAAGCNEGALHENLRFDFHNHIKSQMIKDILAGEQLEAYVLPLKSSVYKNWKILDGLLLGRKGAAKSALALSPLIKINDQVIGVDKLEHMFGNGFNYYTRYYDKGMPIKKVLKKGIIGEKTYLGGNILATGVFTYGDLSANFNGMRFWNHVTLKYDDILGKQYNAGPYVSCQDNRWVVANPVDMRTYIDVTMDESINCSKMATKRGVRKLKAAIKNLELEGIETCLTSMTKLEAMIPKYSNKNIYKYILNFDGIEDVSYLNEF